MAHQYKVGDKVRIIERRGLREDYPFPFGDYMSSLAGVVCKINKISPVSVQFPKSYFYNGDDHVYDLRPILPDSRDFVWAWHSSMFEPVLKDPEQKIQTLTSLEEGDLVPICDMIGKIRYYRGFEYSGYYLEFDYIDEQEHFACCAKLRELVSNFDKIADEYDPTQHKPGYFPEFSTISDLMNFVQTVNNVYKSKKSITTTKTLNENEIKFQKPKAAFSRGSVPKGNPICGRKHKTAIVVGCLSNQEISC